MEYERIHKVQSGVISPSKLRMKLIGIHHHKEMDGSNSNSSRTSPSKLQDNDIVRNSLLATNDADCDDEVKTGQGNHVNPRMHQFAKSDSGNSSSVHPVRTLEDENLDYDSNASSSGFEFHKGERSVHNPIFRSLSRPMSSKWNDAEKWIMNRQNLQPNEPMKPHLLSKPNKFTSMTNMVRVVPESSGQDKKLPVKRADFCLPTSQMSLAEPTFGLAYDPSSTVDLCSKTEDLKEVENMNATGGPAIRSVSMRDMGTEMTPTPSQEPSRTATPMGSITPLRSPISSTPSTPRGGGPPPTSNGQKPDDKNHELSEQELKLKARQEIVALGLQLGKVNIAAWASRDEKEKGCCVDESSIDEKSEQVEFEKRAAVWEEAEKAKHTARFKREEIKIQAWESEQKAKLEAEMRRIEAKIEQMKAHAHAKMVKKIGMLRQKSEEKRAAAESRRNRQADKTASQVDYIRQTGHIPPAPFTCCGWLS